MKDDDLSHEESSDTELDAQAHAAELCDLLEDADAISEGLPNFFERMAGYKQDSYAHLELRGCGVLTQAFVWWLEDQSVLIFGVHENDEWVTAVLPPGCEFTPLAYYEGQAFTLH